MLIGNVGMEPEVKYYDTDQCVAKVSLATTERGYTMKNGTKVPDRTDWHTLLFYRQMAKIVEQYVHKGDKIYVDGRLHYNSYDDRRDVAIMSLKLWWRTWNCLHRSQRQLSLLLPLIPNKRNKREDTELYNLLL